MTSDKNTKWTRKRIVAIIALILLVGLYVFTFFVALFYPVGAGNLFGVCLMATIAVPLLAWIYIWLYGQMTGKETIADLKILQNGDMADDAARTADEAAEDAIDEMAPDETAEDATSEVAEDAGGSEEK